MSASLNDSLARRLTFASSPFSPISPNGCEITVNTRLTTPGLSLFSPRRLSPSDPVSLSVSLRCSNVRVRSVRDAAQFGAPPRSKGGVAYMHPCRSVAGVCLVWHGTKRAPRHFIALNTCWTVYEVHARLRLSQTSHSSSVFLSGGWCACCIGHSNRACNVQKNEIGLKFKFPELLSRSQHQHQHPGSCCFLALLLLLP